MMPSSSPLVAQGLLDALRGAMAGGSANEVDRLVGALLAIDAQIGPQWRGLAMVSRHNGALAHARGAMRCYVRQTGQGPQQRFEEAAFLAEIGDLTAAADRLTTVPRDVPDAGTHAHFAGTLALNTGRLDVARDRLQEALAVRPRSGATWLSLVEAQRGRPAKAWAHEVLRAEAIMKDAPDQDRAAFSYARGSALHALGRHDEAFDAFTAGAAIVRRHVRYNFGVDEAAARQAMSGVPSAAPPGIATLRPIFVFGMPRSGTTLVEQILASHSAVADGGEIGLFDRVAERIGGLSAAHLARAIETSGSEALAGHYLRLLAERFGSEGRVVDKSLNMSRFVGIVAAVLPDAPLVVVRRDALDTAWSCFRTWFAQGVTWSWDLPDIARHMAIEDRMLTHWRAVLGNRLLVLDYTALIENPRETISTLLAHCGLPVEPGVFAPHLTQRAVVTASASQVRQPINRSGLGVAEPYRRHLHPFIDTYRALGGTIG